MEKEISTVTDAVQTLRASKEAHLDTGMYMLKEGDLFPLDLLAVATLNRSLCLIAGFTILIESKNFISAAPLFRMQLDNCLRFSAAWMVEEPHDFARQVLHGVQIRRLKDRGGRFLTDRHLVEQLAIEHPWVKSTYEQSSGYVHLSDKHIFNCMTLTSLEERSVSLKIGEGDNELSDALYLELVIAFIEATNLLLRFAHGWAFTKDNANAVAEMKRQDERRE
jgi:hypothetical protein